MEVGICKSRPSEIFPRIRLGGCIDGHDFRRSADCQEWLKYFLAYTQMRAKPLANVRIYPHRHGGATYLAVDIDPDNPNDDACVIITIFPSGDRVVLDAPADGQLDIELPGIVDALWLASRIASALINSIENSPIKLWFGSRDVQ